MARLRRRPSTRRSRRGQALVEFALAFPIFFFLLIGLIEGGRYVFYSETLNHGAREGARYAIIHGGNSAAGLRTGPDTPGCPSDDTNGDFVREAIRNAAVGFNDPDGIVIPDPVYAPTNNCRGSAVTVTIQYTYTPIVSVFGPITIEAEATLVVNN